jgi:plastocyanin
MRRVVPVGLLAGLAVAGLAAVVAAPGGAGINASHAASHAVATTRVTVTARDSGFTLSRRSAPIGTVIFAVTNKGKISHDFKIAGKKTPLLSPGRSATLRVTFSKKGRYPYRSTVSGQASAGMKGVFSVAAAVVPTPTPPTPTPPTPTPPPPYVPPTGPVGNANTTVTVGLFDANRPEITLSQNTIPSGNVMFAITNHCVIDKCSFDLVGVKAGALLDKDQSETWTVALAPGTYLYHCDVDPDHMKGAFTVTP